MCIVYEVFPNSCKLYDMKSNLHELNSSKWFSTTTMQIIKLFSKKPKTKLSNVIKNFTSISYGYIFFQSSKLQETLDKCQRYEQTIGDLQTKIEMSQEFAGSMDITKQESLVAASASDKLAASRAMKQNQQLKQTVEELENAIVQVVKTEPKHLHICNIITCKSSLQYRT